MAHLDTQVQDLHHDVMEIGGEDRNVTMRIRRLCKEQEHHSEATLNQQAEQEDLTGHLHSLEDELATMRQQILAAEAWEALAEQRVEEATREMSEMVGHLVRHFDI